LGEKENEKTERTVSAILTRLMTSPERRTKPDINLEFFLAAAV